MEVIFILHVGEYSSNDVDCEYVAADVMYL
jgi:hypothetical protein